MNTRDLSLIGGILFVCFISFQFDRYLKASGARRWVRIVALFSALPIVALGALGRFSADPRYFYFLIASVAIWVSVLGARGWYLRWLKTRVPVVALAEAVLDMRAYARELMTRSEPNQTEISTLQSHVAGLRMFREPQTAEYIDLVTAEMEHFIDGSPWPARHEGQARLADLERKLQAELHRLGVKGRATTLSRGP